MTPRSFKCRQFNKIPLDFSLDFTQILQNDFSKQRCITLNESVLGQCRINPKTHVCRIFCWVYVCLIKWLTKYVFFCWVYVCLIKWLTKYVRGSGVAQCLGRRISDKGVPGSNPGRCTFRCGLEQVTFTLLSTG